MKASPLLHFPLDEYQDRIRRLCAAMARDRLDAIILTSDDTTWYFSGFQSIVWDSKVSTPLVLVITRDGDLAAATSKSGRATAGATSCVEDLRFVSRDGGKDGGYPTLAAAITAPLAERKLLGGRIGLEFANGTKMHLNHQLREELFAALGSAERVDCSAALWSVRSIKSAREIGEIRECCRMNCAGYAAGFAALHEGMTERELYRAIVIEYFRQGAERSLLLGVRAGPDRYSQGNCPPSNRPIGRGEIILVDGGPINNGYYSDIIRNAVIGGATERQRGMFAAAREACYAGIAAMRPGTRISDVCAVIDRHLDGSPYAAYNAMKGWCGHSIGTGVHEYPLLESRCTDLLQPGMVFAVEPYFFQDGVGSLGIEENVLVTENGPEILTPLPSDLLVVDA